jgi:hypothetical protein
LNQNFCYSKKIVFLSENPEFSLSTSKTAKHCFYVEVLFLAVYVLGTTPKKAQQCSQRVKNDLVIEDQALPRSYDLAPPPPIPPNLSRQEAQPATQED